MGAQPTQRRLAAVLAADIAGYSRLMNEDEAATVDAWQAARAEVIKPSIAEYSGRIVKHTGDGFLAEFPTVSEAVLCAVTMQRNFAQLNADIPDPRRMKFRMGINLGEITVDEDDIHGD
ncbi:MAG: adenylate/guanylate cyclase domain-containing protein [Rhodospirillales bacterium]|nr:adenylate/guanylate cyclase domain-containing protein [Rhodospirillales bacterium]